MLCRKVLVGGTSRFIHTTPAVDRNFRKPLVIANIDNHEFHKVIKWVKPEKLRAWDPRRSGDLRPLEKIDPSWLKLEYQPFADILDKLPEEHRKIFTVEFGRRRDGTRIILENNLAKTRRHIYDNKSLDFKITWSTWKIRSIQNLFETMPIHLRSPALRITVKELIEKRGEWLYFMRGQDYKRFEWIIEVLGLIFKNDPPKVRVERKASVNLLVNLYCNELRDKKMAEYKAELEAEKIPFLMMKLETLTSIRSDELSVGLSSSVDEDILNTRKLLRELEKSQNNMTTIHPGKINDGDKENLKIS